MEIVEVDGPEDTASVRLFLAVAREVYRHDPVWVPNRMICSSHIMQRQWVRTKSGSRRWWRS